MRTYQRIHEFVDRPGAVPTWHRYTVKLNHWLPNLTPWHEYAITLGHTVYVAGPRCWPELHAHEFRHVVQWAAYGRIGMALYYLRSLVTLGYAKNWAEVEASAWGKAHKDEFGDINPDNVSGAGIEL